MTVLSKQDKDAIIKAYGPKTAEDVKAMIKDLMKDTFQSILDAELTVNLGYEKHDIDSKNTDNSRNGHYPKTVQSEFGNLELNIPRDRHGEHGPLIVKKGQRDISSLSDRIISMYGKGMSTRDIRDHMQDIYGLELSAEKISDITDQILPTIRQWQSRPLQSLYVILYMDGIHLTVRQDSKTVKKAIYIAMGIDCDGMKDVLGIWVEGTLNESAKYWLSVLTELKNRGVKDILISCIDGLSGFSEAIQAVFPQTDIQRCIVHQIRYCCKFVNYKDRKAFCADMKPIYQAPPEEAALQALLEFDQKWGKKYTYAVKSWESNWANLATFFKYSAPIRRLIYTTNPIESMNSSIRKIAGPKRIFPTDDAVLKSVFLAVSDRLKKWTARLRDWSDIFNQLSIHFAHRLGKGALNL